MEITPIFTNFIASDNLNSKLDNSKVHNYCYDVCKSNSDKNVTTYFDFKEPELQNLFFEIQQRLDVLHKHFQFSEKYSQYLYDSWVNINDTPYINQPHVHAKAQNIIFSGVYYVKAEIDSPTIEFLSPIAAHPYVIDINKVDKFNNFNSTKWKVQPSSGDLIIFPCWMMHYVTKNYSTQDRISIAFNSIMV